MSQIQLNTSLFYLDQDHIGIEKLLVLRIGLGNLKAAETLIMTSKVTYETSGNKISKIK
jgi:hypothetical protein